MTQSAIEEMGGLEGYAIRRLIAQASVAFNCPAEDIISKNPRRENRRAATFCRQGIWYALREMGWSSTSIGRAFGRDHSTVLSGCAQFKRALDEGLPGANLLFRELLCPGTVKSLDVPLPELEELARVNREVESLKSQLALAQGAPEYDVALHTALKAMSDKIGRLEAERDHFFGMRNRAAELANRERQRRQTVELILRTRDPEWRPPWEMTDEDS